MKGLSTALDGVLDAQTRKLIMPDDPRIINIDTGHPLLRKATLMPLLSMLMWVCAGASMCVAIGALVIGFFSMPDVRTVGSFLAVGLLAWFFARASGNLHHDLLILSRHHINCDIIKCCRKANVKVIAVYRGGEDD